MYKSLAVQELLFSLLFFLLSLYFHSKQHLTLQVKRRSILSIYFRNDVTFNIIMPVKEIKAETSFFIMYIETTLYCS